MDVTVKGNKLTIVVDLSKDQGPSSSGKSTIVATTNGFMELPGSQCKLSINVIKPLARRKLASVG